MALTTDEALKLALEAEELFKVIKTALKKDKDGKVHLTPAETKQIILGLTKLAASITREYLD
ncbi:MAG: hypothetical protein EBT79_02455 [Actinobacteria bacterium]|nr:hypothetical protein [Actinomycetota bacterium]